jgi:hypothetical protein
MLLGLAYGDDTEAISVAAIVSGLRYRAIGLSMLVFALPCCLPMPPGVPTVCGAAIVIIALHLVVGWGHLWVPGWIGRREIARSDLRRLVDRVRPSIERFERLCQPRLAAVTEGVSKALIGLVVLLLGAILVLPIPILGNLPPGLAVTVIAIGLSERDGVVTLAGVLLAGLAILLTGGMAWAALTALQLAL